MSCDRRGLWLSQDDVPTLTDPGLELVYAAFAVLRILVPVQGLVFWLLRVPQNVVRLRLGNFLLALHPFVDQLVLEIRHL